MYGFGGLVYLRSDRGDTGRRRTQARELQPTAPLGMASPSRPMKRNAGR